MRPILLCAALLLLIPLAAAQADRSQIEKACGLPTYQDSLDLAFQQATAGHGETLVTLQVLRSFQREYALVVKQEGSELKLFRATFRDQLWGQLGPLQNNKTRQDCLDEATTAEMDTVQAPVSAEQANSLWTTFRSSNFQTDNCAPARWTRHCALIFDGARYASGCRTDVHFVLRNWRG